MTDAPRQPGKTSIGRSVPPVAATPTLRDLARKLGVSRTTVSLALNNHPRIPEVTRRKICSAAAQLGYRPDPKVSRLMTYLRLRRRSPASEVIAVVNSFPQREPWLTNTHLRAVHDGIVARAPSLGFAVEDLWLGEPGMTPGRLSGILRARGIVGVVLLSFPRYTETLDLDWREFACTAIGHSLGVPLHRVSAHQYRDMDSTLKALAAAGYQRPGLVINPDVDRRVEHYYVAAFLVAQHGRPPPERVEPLLFTGGKTQFLRWLEEQQPDVLIVSQPPPERTELHAWLAATGRQCPRDIGLALLDLPHGGETASGIRQPYGEIGAAAIDMVAGQISRGERGLPSLPQIVKLPGEWRQGNTTRIAECGLRSAD